MVLTLIDAPHLHDGMVIERLIGDPGDRLGLTLRVDLGVFEKVHAQIEMGLIERRVIDLRRHGR